MRVAPPVLPGAQTVDSPLDRALALLLAGEREAALRWSAAVVQQDASVSSALILTCRLLADAGRTEAAVEGFVLGVKRAIDTGNLPLAVAAVGDLKMLGANVDEHLEEIAAAFCLGSPRLSEDAAPPPPPLPSAESFQPLSSFLTGPALLSKATQIIHGARAEYDELADGEPPLVSPIPLFSALEKEGLRALIGCFEMITVPAGKEVIVEGEEGAEAYIVARGELVVRRKDDDDGRPIDLARLANGALFGEMALLSRAPRAASVVAHRPSILLVARREALEAVALTRPDVGVELAAHCRRRMVANLLRVSRVLLSVPSAERPALVERFETKVFETGDKLIENGRDTSGLHLIASGEVGVVGREDSGENFQIASLGVGETVGEVALVLRRKANADVVAVHPTVTLHLPREEFLGLIKDHPAILASLYLCAVERDEETTSVLAGSSAVALAEDYDLV
ncbi:MAG: cyclic nucleotide-binding domain-containing protein [Labilithrix sp.]|nr:cyclic nucleotide-binding domain-containing protein [Labilithrix sp.]MCW5812728.1 cyclic nucleotide-binding domain-containing protein [Labilithrix sp.]